MRFDSLAAWLNWQESLHPDEIELGLDRTAAVWHNLISQPLNSFIISVAGTNGKGSCVGLLEQIFLAAGYKVGSYTSPHLYRYNERIKINGEPVSDTVLCDAFEKVDQARCSHPQQEPENVISLTYFEFGTLAALSIFQEQAPDVIILEVGMGGRLDAVNILDADIALISSIDLDHQQWLGETREQIAFEKAGIMRANKPVVYADVDCPQAVISQAQKLSAPLARYDIDFHVNQQADAQVWHWQGQGQDQQQRVRNLPRLKVHGEQIYKNAAAVVQVVELAQAHVPVSHQAMRLGMHAFSLPGRLEIVTEPVTQIFDVAHNRQSIANLTDWLAQHPVAGRTLAVFGMMAERLGQLDFTAIVGQIDEWHVSQANIARAAPAKAVAEAIKQVGAVSVICHETLSQAYQTALTLTKPDDRLVIFGSFYTVAQTRPESI